MGRVLWSIPTVYWSCWIWCLSQRLVSMLFGVNAAETPAKVRIPTSTWSQRNFIKFAGRESIGAFIFGGQSDNLNCAKLRNQIVLFTPTLKKEIGLITNRVVSQTNQACCLSFCVSFQSATPNKHPHCLKYEQEDLGSLSEYFYTRRGTIVTSHGAHTHKAPTVESNDELFTWTPIWSKTGLHHLRQFGWNWALTWRNFIEIGV